MSDVKPGLEGVVAGETAICSVRPEGELIYRGYDVHDLAEQASFEEVATWCCSAGFPPGPSWRRSTRSFGPTGRCRRAWWRAWSCFPRTRCPWMRCVRRCRRWRSTTRMPVTIRAKPTSERPPGCWRAWPPRWRRCTGSPRGWRWWRRTPTSTTPRTFSTCCVASGRTSSRPGSWR